MKKQLLLLVMMLLPLVANADQSGICGPNLTWTYVDATHTLTISGTGEMTSYRYNNAPWYGIRNSIQNVILESGITSIGERAFCDCTGLTSVTIHNTPTYMGTEIFQNCENIKEAVFDCETVPSLLQYKKSLEKITMTERVTSIAA